MTCDHYHLWQQDIEMIQGLGVDAHRLSIAWPRILPQDGVVNQQQGLEFYGQIIDECHARGMKVYVTLYPLGSSAISWRQGRLAKPQKRRYKFAEYAEVVSKYYFGDNIDVVHHTLNEPFVSAFLGYRWGEHAPGIKEVKKRAT